MNKMVSLVCCLCLILSLSGCWDYRELNQIAIITGIAVDKGEKHKYKLTVEKLDPMELNPRMASGNTPSIIHSLEGDSLSDIAQKMNVGLSRKMVFSHVRTAVISDEIAKKGIMDFFDFLERYREIREDFNVIIAKGVKAKDILKVSYPIQKVSTIKLHAQLNTAMEEFGSDPYVRKKDIISAWTSEGRQPVMAAVTVTGPKQKGNSVDNMKQLEAPAMVQLAGMSVFKGQKLVGIMSIQDTRNYLWIQNRLKTTGLAVPCEKNKFSSIRVFRTSSKVEASYRNHIPFFNVIIKAESQLNGTQCNIDLEKPSTYFALEKQTNKRIEQDVAKTIRKVQEKYKSDIFGFGEVMEHADFRDYNRVKKHWDKEFSRAQIQVHATVTLRRSGIRTKSYLTEIK